MTTLFAGVLLPVGTRSFGPFPVAQGAAAYLLTFDNASFIDPLMTVDLTSELSYDGGVTWLPGGACHAQGGTVWSPKSPNLVGMGISIPDPGNANRQIRGTVTVGGLPFVTTASLTIA